MKTLSNINELKLFIVPNITDLITVLDNNRKLAKYTGENINKLYRYLEIFGSPTNLNSSGQRYHNCGDSYFTNNDTSILWKFIAGLCVRQKTIFECCGIIGHKDDACIIYAPIFLPKIIIIKISQFNALDGDKTTEPPIGCNIQPTEAHTKYHTSPNKTSPVVFSITGRLN